MTPIEEKPLHNLAGAAGIDTAEINPQIGYYENKQHLQSLDLRGKTYNYTQEEVEQIEQQQEAPDALTLDIRQTTQESRHIVILGSRGEWKTTAGFWLLEGHHKAGRPCCIYNHPKPNLLPNWIRNHQKIEEMPPNAAIFVDECANDFDSQSYRKRNNEYLKRILIQARQNGDIGQSYIFATTSSNFINLNFIRLIDSWMLKQPNDAQRNEERRTVRKLYEMAETEGYLPLAKDEFYWSGKVRKGGKLTRPEFFTQELSHAYGSVDMPTVTF